MSYISFNGKIIAENVAIATAQNRGLKYGDGLFETLVSKNGNLVLWKEHSERLWEGMQKLQFETPAYFSKKYLHDEVCKLIHKNKHNNGDARVRVNIIRGSGGLFDPENLNVNLIIESWQLPHQYELNSNGLQLCIYEDAFKICDSFSKFKHNNFLPYTMGALYAKERKVNDSVILNQYQRISDTCISNIFLIKNKEIFTPAITEGCIAGIIRNILVKKLPEIGYAVYETNISVTDLLNADEIFLTNSVSPIKWVSSLQNNSYNNKNVLNIYKQLSTLLPEYFQ